MNTTPVFTRTGTLINYEEHPFSNLIAIDNHDHSYDFKLIYVPEIDKICCPDCITKMYACDRWTSTFDNLSVLTTTKYVLLYRLGINYLDSRTYMRHLLHFKTYTTIKGVMKFPQL